MRRVRAVRELRAELRAEELRAELRAARLDVDGQHVGHRLRRRLADDEERAYLRPQHLGLHPRAPQVRARTALPLITPSSRKAPLGAAAAGGGASAAGGGSRSRPPTTGSESAGARRTLLGSLSRQPSPHGARHAAGVLLLQIAALRLLPAACRARRSAARRGGAADDALLAAATASHELAVRQVAVAVGVVLREERAGGWCRWRAAAA